MDFFKHFMSDKQLIEAIRIFSDSCAAQTENYSLSIVLSALPKELGVTFELTWPVVRHSFLPADRMFGRLEKILLTPYDYYSPLFLSVAQVRQLTKTGLFSSSRQRRKIYYSVGENSNYY